MINKISLPTLNPNQMHGALLLGLLSGATGGFFISLLARLSMRVIALIAGETPSFSVDGTMFIIILGILIGAWIGLLYGLFLPSLPGSTGWKGVYLGTLLAVLVALPILFIDPQGELALVPSWAILILFAPLPILFGLILSLVTRRLVNQDFVIQKVNASFVVSAGVLTALIALAGAAIELLLALTHPATVSLGYENAVMLENVAGAALIIAMLIALSGLLRMELFKDKKIVKVGLGFTLLLLFLLGMILIFDGRNTMDLYRLADLTRRSGRDEGLIPLLGLIVLGNLGLLPAAISIFRQAGWSGWQRPLLILIVLLPFFSLLLLHHDLLPSLLRIDFGQRSLIGHLSGALYALLWSGFGLAMRGSSQKTQTTNLAASNPAV